MTLSEATARQPWSVRPALWDLLATGPFEQALRAAIRHSGLSLDRLRHRLSVRDSHVSVATLSHWQSGRSQPERPESLVAVGHLEELLNVPKGALVALLRAPRPRGRWRAQDVLPLAAAWPQQDVLPALLAGFDTGGDDALVRLSHHDLVRIGAERGEESLRVRQLLRAVRDGVDRGVFVYHVDEPSGSAPTIETLRHCRVGKTAYDPGSGYLVADIVFDRALCAGQMISIEYTVHCGPTGPSTEFERKLRFPVREYLLEVAFDPAALPTRCYHYARSDVRRPPERFRGLKLDPSHCAQLVKLDAAPGLQGIRWHWD